MHDGRYQSYSVMATAPSTPLVAMGNIHGYLKILLLGMFDEIALGMVNILSRKGIQKCVWKYVCYIRLFH